MIYPKLGQNLQMVAKHYEELDVLFRQMWSTHLHHGLWVSGKEDVETAVRNMVRLVAEKSRLKAGEKVCDIGCGYGATSLMLVKEWSAQVSSITLSQTQYDYICSLNLGSNPHFICGNWLENNLSSDAFDVAIAIESSEHMPDKEKFFQEAFRVLRPGGRLAICAWLANEQASDWDKRLLLEPICQEAHLPSMGSPEDYMEMMKRAGFENVNYTDISRQVKKTWLICARRLIGQLFSNKAIYRLLFSRQASERLFAITLFRMMVAYQKHCLLYGIFVAEKPQINAGELTAN